MDCPCSVTVNGKKSLLVYVDQLWNITVVYFKLFFIAVFLVFQNTVVASQLFAAQVHSSSFVIKTEVN